MKINEYNQMMNYLTRKSPPERQRLAKGTKSDTKVMPKKSKILEYIDDHNIVYGDKKSTKAEGEAAAKRIDSYKNQMSKQDEYNTYFNKKSQKYYKAEKPKPIKPDLPNGHSDWSADDLMDAIDPSWWLPDDPDKKAGILEFELADEYWQEQYNQYLNNGGTLNFNQFMQQQNNMKVSKKINKIAEEKKDLEGIASILALSSGKRI